jgi:hypothetical protein
MSEVQGLLILIVVFALALGLVILGYWYGNRH